MRTFVKRKFLKFWERPKQQDADLYYQVMELLCKDGFPRGEYDPKHVIRSLGTIMKQHYPKLLEQVKSVAKQGMSELNLTLPNARKGEDYLFEQRFVTPQYVTEIMLSIDAPGLSASYQAGRLVVKGIPLSDGTFTLTMRYKYDGWTTSKPWEEHTCPLVVMVNPRDMWKNIPTSQTIPYYKPDAEIDYVEGPRTIVAASQRGRSHAHEGKPRDDHFAVAFDEATGWYVLCVADGAGSAEFSREGSRLACTTALHYCQETFKQEELPLEQAMLTWGADLENTDLKRAAHIKAYELLANAALKASEAIKVEAQSKEHEVKKYATTLLLTLCKKSEVGWLIASFWIGDGGIAVYDQANNSVNLMGTPDGGEYAGQTRFLTMPDIFKDAINRIRVAIVPDFTALLLMTDGITDPKFETDANLKNITYYHNLWEELYPVLVEETATNRSQKLLEWMDFWSVGNHDDRTMAILY